MGSGKTILITGPGWRRRSVLVLTLRIRVVNITERDSGTYLGTHLGGGMCRLGCEREPAAVSRHNPMAGKGGAPSRSRPLMGLYPTAEPQNVSSPVIRAGGYRRSAKKDAGKG